MDGPLQILTMHAPASDWTAYGDPAIPVDDVEPWARHALAANGFGDSGITDATRTLPVPAARTSPSHRSTAMSEVSSLSSPAGDAAAVKNRQQVAHVSKSTLRPDVNERT
jgi:hypothetical protein